MKYLVTVGPVEADELGAVITKLSKFSKLKSILVLDAGAPAVQHRKGNSKTGIKRKFISDAMREQMIELRTQGYNAHQIAGLIGCSYMTVRRYAPRTENL